MALGSKRSLGSLTVKTLKNCITTMILQALNDSKLFKKSKPVKYIANVADGAVAYLL
jgi:hypothetical protein